ncbi:MAG: J domain-containing protein [Gammaproteobacteria bacterium]
MKFEEILIGSWRQYSIPNIQTKYKLHIAIPMEHFERSWETVYELLKKATDDGIIAGMKVLNVGGEEGLEARVASSETTLSENPRARVCNNPFTIYLFDKIDAHQCKKLIQSIDSLLNHDNIPGINNNHLSRADIRIPTSTHVSFRQESLDGPYKYIAVHSASNEELEKLRAQGEKSEGFLSLIAPSIDLATEQNKKDSELLAFYNQNYRRLDTAMNSLSIETQFSHAAWFLGIDKSTFLDEKDPTKKQGTINREFRKQSIKYHPDKTGKSVKSQAGELFRLLESCKTLIEKVLENPKLVLDEKTLLQQEPNLPKHQYELSNFHGDPYYYKAMAKTSVNVTLYQHWESTKTEKNISGPNERSLIIYSTALTVYTQKKTIIKPWYEAFLLLLSAGALPSRFDQHHLRDVFNEEDGLLTHGQQWLLSKVLNTELGLMWLDSDDIIHLARLAQKHHVSFWGDNAGERKDDIFIALYQTWPQTLYARRISKILYLDQHWSEIISIRDTIDHEKINNVFLQDTDHLALLPESALVELIKSYASAKNHILQHRHLSLRLSTHYWHHVLIPKFFDDKCMPSATEWKTWAAQQLMNGNVICLEIFSAQALKELKEYITNNLSFVPWLSDYIDQASAALAGDYKVVPDFLATEFYKKHVREWHWSNKPISSPLDLIKETVFSGDLEILSKLNDETLGLITDDEHCSWPLLFNIACIRTNLDNNKLSEAQQFKTVLEKMDLIDAGITTWTQLITLVDSDAELQEKTNNAVIIERKLIVDNLLCEYEKNLKNNSSPADLQAQRGRIQLLGGTTKPIDESFRSSLIEIYKECFADMKKNGPTPEVQKAFQALRSQCEGMGERFYIPSYWAGESLPSSGAGFCDSIGKHNNAPLNELYKLLDSVICINNPRICAWHPEWAANKNAIDNTFGLHRDDNALKQLHTLHDAYACLGAVELFYSRIQSLTKKSAALKYDPSLTWENAEPIIEEHLLNYLDNELAVVCEGQRLNAGYKTKRHEIKDPKELVSLYVQMEKADHMLDKLKGGYELIKKTQNINAYIPLRLSTGNIDPTLENIAIQTELNTVITNTFKKTHLPYSDGYLARQLTEFNNPDIVKALALKNSVKAGDYNFNAPSDNVTLTPETQRLLDHVNDYLSSTPESVNRTAFITSLQSNPLLKLYFFNGNTLIDHHSRIQAITQAIQAPAPKLLLKDRSADPDSVQLDQLKVQAKAVLAMPMTRLEAKKTGYFTFNKNFIERKIDVLTSITGSIENATTTSQIHDIMRTVSQANDATQKPLTLSYDLKPLTEHRIGFIFNSTTETQRMVSDGFSKLIPK